MSHERFSRVHIRRSARVDRVTLVPDAAGLRLTLPLDALPEAAAQFLAGWQAGEAGDFRPAGLEALSALGREAAGMAADVGAPVPAVRLAPCPGRWGLCRTAEKLILLSPLLADYPLEAAREVLLHEVLHLIEPTHSRRFWQLMNSRMSDWPRWEGLLRGHWHRMKGGSYGIQWLSGDGAGAAQCPADHPPKPPRRRRF